MNGVWFRNVISYPAASMPLAIFMLANDEDRRFVEQIYFEYRGLMYFVARKYFGQNKAEIEDAISLAIENMCKYVENFRAVECNKLKSYVLSTVENVCKRRLRELGKQRAYRDEGATQEMIENIPGTADVYASVFAYADARALLDELDGLGERDKELFWMRHVEKLTFSEIANQLGMTEITVRTALTRAKQRVQKRAAERRNGL